MKLSDYVVRFIVDQGVKGVVAEDLVGLPDEMLKTGRVCKVCRNVVGPQWVGAAMGGNFPAGAGDHAPTLVHEALHRGMADALARPRQDDCLDLGVHAARV